MKWPFTDEQHRPAWDHDQAERLHGSTVLVGLTYNEPAGMRQEQIFGTVMAADPDEGITLRLEGRRSGQVYTLPPDLGAFIPAKPGTYRLRSTGEIVVDPDYTTSWTSTPQKQ